MRPDPRRRSNRPPARPDDEAAEDAAEDGAVALRDGTVTRVASQQRDPHRVSVFIDGAFAFGLTLDLAVEAGLRAGRAITVPEQEALLAREHVLRARRAALDYLAGSARTTVELRRKLREKGYAEAAVEAAVEAVRAMGYLDDAAYAAAYVRGRFTGRGYGPARLRADLQRRGVPREAIDAALAALEAEEDLDEAALTHARRRWHALAAEADPRKRRKKALDFLLRRGFAFDAARRAVEAVAARDGAADDAPDDGVDGDAPGGVF